MTLHVERGFPAKQRLIALGSNDGKTPIINTAFIKDAGKLLLGLAQFFPGLQASDVEHTPDDQLLLSRLDGKVRLGKYDLFFSRISVLGHEIASVAGHGDVLDLSLGCFARLDHFNDVNKMIGFGNVNTLCCLLRFPYDFGEVLPAGIAKQGL